MLVGSAAGASMRAESRDGVLASGVEKGHALDRLVVPVLAKTSKEDGHGQLSCTCYKLLCICRARVDAPFFVSLPNGPRLTSIAGLVSYLPLRGQRQRPQRRGQDAAVAPGFVEGIKLRLGVQFGPHVTKETVTMLDEVRRLRLEELLSCEDTTGEAKAPELRLALMAARKLDDSVMASPKALHLRRPTNCQPCQDLLRPLGSAGIWDLVSCVGAKVTLWVPLSSVGLGSSNGKPKSSTCTSSHSQISCSDLPSTLHMKAVTRARAMARLPLKRVRRSACS